MPDNHTGALGAELLEVIEPCEKVKGLTFRSFPQPSELQAAMGDYFQHAFINQQYCQHLMPPIELDDRPHP